MYYFRIFKFIQEHIIEFIDTNLIYSININIMTLKIIKGSKN